MPRTSPLFAALPWLACAAAFAAGTASPPDATPVTSASYSQRLAAARTAYFQDLEGQHDADSRARQSFDALYHDNPHDPVVKAYSGSLELLEAARTWAVWKKHTLSEQGLQTMDDAVNAAPDNLEARFVRAMTTWHLPFFFHRKAQAESDLTSIGPRAEQASRTGQLPPQLAAAALDYYGQVLESHDDRAGARQAFAAALRVDAKSPGGQDAHKRLSD